MITIRYLLLCLILPVSVAVQAQTEEEEVRFYDVEVIIFKNLNALKSNELTLPVSSPSRGEEMLDISSPASVKKAEENSYLLLPSEQLRRHDRFLKIVESPYYELLTHIGWRQPGLSLEESLPVWIRGGKIFGKEYVSIDNRMVSPINTDDDKDQDVKASDLSNTTNRKIYELEGKITVSLSRYLHAHTDLVLRKPRLYLADVETTESQPPTNSQITKAYILDNYSLKEQRRMRSKSLHYLDSPEFSMLILMTPYIIETAVPVETMESSDPVETQ